MTAPTYSSDTSLAQRRTLQVLFVSSVFARAAMSIGFVVTALIIEGMLGSARWSGLSTAAITVGTAISAARLSKLMDRQGRRRGLALGFAIGAAGSLAAALLSQTGWMFVYLIALVFFGVGPGSANLARYAAADLAADDARSKSIGLIVFAATVGAVSGPALAGVSDDIGVALGFGKLAGPLIAASIFFVIAYVIVAIFLRPDPLLLAKSVGVVSRSDVPVQRATFTDSLAIIAASPRARVALVALIICQSVMVMVMAMTPLHMDAHGHDIDLQGYVIAAHTTGMYAFAPIAGWLTTRIGREPTIILGSSILIAATVITALATEAPLALMYGGLYLLGLGWSFAFVSASTLITEAVEPQHQVSVQGAADVVTAIASGGAATASGFVFTMAGFHILSMIGILASGVLLIFTYLRSRTYAFS